MLECSLTKYEEQNVIEWQGGCTRELFIYSVHQDEATGFYTENQERVSIFEVTSSTMEYPETEYSIFSGYERLLMVIGGSTILSHEDGREAELDKYDYHMFSGNEIIHSKGLATDYELIFKNGNKGEFRLIDAEQSDICVEKHDDYAYLYVGFYCDGEHCKITVEGKRFVLGKGDHLSLIADETMLIGVEDNRGITIQSTIYFN